MVHDITALAQRWPKVARGGYADGVTSFQGAVDGSRQQNVLFAVRPRAYSNVSEVIPWVAMHSGGVGGSCRGEIYSLRAAITQGSAVQFWTPGSGAASFDQHVLFPTFEADRYYFGALVAQAAAFQHAYSLGTNILTDSSAFRSDWNAATEDDWMVFTVNGRLIVSSSVSTQVAEMCGMTIVQRPDTQNRSTTHWLGWDPSLRPTSNNVEFDGTPIRRFRYVASEFASLTGVRLVLFLRNASSTAATVTIRLREGLTASGTTSTIVHSAAVTHTGVAGVLAWRSIDLSSILVDGHYYWITLESTNVASSFNATGTIWAILDFEQQAGFLKTTTYFMAKNRRILTNTGPLNNFGAGDLYAPLFFQNIQNYHRPFRQWANFAQDGTSALEPQVRTRAPTEADAVRACSINADPRLTSGTGSAGLDIYNEGPISNSSAFPDACFGDRILYPDQDSPWSGGGIFADLQMSMTFDVLEVLGPAIGDLFDTTALDPVGCVSTAAGAGTPGILMISNGAGIPKKFVPDNPEDEQIQDAGIPAPYPGEVPSTTVTNAGISPTGGLGIGTYVYAYTLRNCCTGKESDPSDNFEVSTSGASPRAAVRISFAGVIIPGDTQICEICIYRTVLDGAFPIMFKVGCFDFRDGTSLYVDDLGDDAFFDANGQLERDVDPLSILNAAPPCVPYIVSHKRRIFGAGSIPLVSGGGTVSTIQGSNIVYGDFDVLWDRCLEGKYIRLQNGCRWYQIDRVLPPEEGNSPSISRLQLLENFKEEGGAGQSYVICGNANVVFYSEPNEPEYWPVVNQVFVEPGDGDFITGLGSSFDRLIICKRRKTYTAAYQLEPVDEVFDPARISPDIGCVGPRTFAQVENATVWLADRGIAYFDGRGVEHLPASDDIHDLFTDPDNPRYMRRNSQGIVPEAVGVNYPVRQQYWLGIPTVRSDRGFDVIVVWNYKKQTITLYEFCQNFLSMVVAKDAQGNERVYLGDDKGFVWVADIGHNDGAGTPGQTKTLRGVTTGATEVFNFVDESATFTDGGLPALGDLSGVAGVSPFLDNEPLGLAGACVFLRPPGEADWFSKTVWAATKQTVYFTPPLATPLPVGTEYMIAPIDFMVETKPTNLGADKNTKKSVDLFLIHEVEEFDSKLYLEVLPDFASDPFTDATISVDGQTVPEDKFMILSHPGGKQRISTGRIVSTYQAYRMRNFAPEEPVRIMNLVPTMEPRP